MARRTDNGTIPFGKAVRVGNWKLWRSRCNTKASGIECVNVSTLDGAWMIRIPSTLEMYGWLSVAYRDYMSDDTATKAQGEAVLVTVLSNILYSSSIVNGYYHRALELCATVYVHPQLLDRKSSEHKDFVKELKRLSEEFLDWRRGYDDEMHRHEPTDEQMHQDELAEEALEKLTEETPQKQ